MLDMADKDEKISLLNKMRPHISALKKYTYGKHIITKLDKQLNRMAGDDLNLSGLSLGNGPNGSSGNPGPVGPGSVGSHRGQDGSLNPNNLNLSGLNINGHVNHNGNSPISILNGSNGSTPINMNGGVLNGGNWDFGV